MAAALVVATVAIPFTASASSTLVVDDDGVECPGAGYTDVQSAIDAAATGDTVEICAGSYGGFDVSTSGVSVVAPSGDDVVVTGSVDLSARDTSLEGPRIEGTATSSDLIDVSAGVVTLSDLEVIAHENATSGAGVHASGVSQVIVSDSTIFGANESGVALVDVQQATVENNAIDNAGAHGIWLDSTADAWVRDNAIEVPDGYGIFVDGTSEDNSVEANSVAGADLDSIRAGANTTGNSFTTNSMALKVGVTINNPLCCPPNPNWLEPHTGYDENVDARDLSGAGLSPTAIHNTWTDNACFVSQPVQICADV